MKLRHALRIAAITILLTACNFSLAADVTPPPDYVPPTPAPTLGPLYPASAPDVANGAAIYADKCAACHGDTGLGDGAQGKQLPVKVAAIGLPAIAQNAKPSDWFLEVTNGNLDRFMPPFTSLNDQERWDVVAYAFTLHTKPDQIDNGKTLFESKCAGCADKFRSLELMSGLSETDLIQIIKTGKDSIPAFGKDFSDDEAAAVAMYLRTLTFAAVLPTPTIAPTSETPVSTQAGTPSAAATAVGGTQAAVTPAGTNAALTGKISGTLENKSGSSLPSGLKVILSGLEHGSDTSTGPQEVLTLTGIVNPDGSYTFENVALPVNRIYVAKITLNGIAYQSNYVPIKTGMTEVAFSPILVYPTTEDTSALKVESLQMFFDFASSDAAQIFGVYSLTNPGTKTILIKLGADQNVPFIAFPEGAQKLGFEAAQNTQSFVPTDNGFAIPPSDKPYGLIAFASIPKANEIAISQPALLPINALTIFLPEGMSASGDILIDGGMKTIQTTNFHVYTAPGVDKGKNFKFTIKGKPVTTAVNPDVTQNKTLLIVAGVLGIALVLAGIWMFIRDRKPVEEADDAEEAVGEFDDIDSIMDAIIALDDLHREGKLTDEAYKTRRDELKNTLKSKS
jgi:mono/diheme cytochrome c family protein